MSNNKYISLMDKVINTLKYFGALLILTLLAIGNTTKAENNIQLSGLVIDAYSKQPVSAAQVVLTNDNVSATTNEAGVFKIKASSRFSLLSVSAYDYNIKDFSFQGKDSVVVELYPVEFTTFYSKINGINGLVNNTKTTNPIKSVTDLSKSTVISIDELIQTEFGADTRAITRSGISGIGSSLFIRGLNSINSNSQPLFVVDGVIMPNLYNVSSIHQGLYSNPLADIDINDIESVSILKDGTTIYGSKGSNGVILITTKRSTNMVTKISLNILTGTTETPATIPVMKANDYKVYVTDLLGTAGLTSNEIGKLAYLNDDQNRSTYNIYHNNTKWSDEIYQSGVAKSYSINVKGGDDKALYYFSLGYTNNKGVVKTTDFERYNMRLNADLKLLEKVKLGINIGFSRIDRTLVDDGINTYTSPTWISQIKSPFLSAYNFTSLGLKTSEYTYTDIFNIGNPAAIIQYSNNTSKQNSFNVSLKPEYSISPNIKLIEQFDYSLNKTTEDYYRPYLYTAPIYVKGYGDSYNERIGQTMRNNAIYSDTRLSFDKYFDAFNHLNAFGGIRYISNKYDSEFVQGHNSNSNSSINLPGGFNTFYTTGINNPTNTLSYYLNGDYNFDNRYYLNAAISMDASSRFGNETKGGLSVFGHSWGVFPSISGAWLISSEKFMSSVKPIHLLKLRAGYSITGNDDLKDFQTALYLSSIRFSGVGNGIVISTLANPQIQWETTGRANLGLDMELFSDRLSLSVDLYSGTTKNLLVLKEFQDVTGLDSYWSNEGQLSNKGYEFSAKTKLLNTKNIRWELGLSAGHYINKITELPNGSFTTPVYDGEVLSAVGSAAGVFYGYKTSGIFSTEAQATAANLTKMNENGSYSSFGAGDVIFEDLADKDGVKNGIIDENDKQIIGNPNPDIYGTASSKFTYKNLTFSALFTYSYGNDIYNYQRSLLESGKDYSNQSTAMNSRWTAEGQSKTSQPKAVFGDPMGNSRFSDRWIEDGSYIRLKTLSLSYNLPLKSTFLESINIWVSANNIFTMTNYLGADPEFSSQNSVLYQGIDAGLVPLSRSYYVGLKFNL
jgi:TonB-linked SusC/RagA family outer membrane protein